MDYLLCWINAKDPNQITTTTSLQQTLSQANQGCEYSLSKIVRLNWMIQHIKIHGVVKPVWCRDSNFQTIVGDTRILAARLAGVPCVPVLAYLKQPQGTPITDIKNILRVAGLEKGGELLYKGSKDILTDPPSWVEISHPSTAGHGHDQMARLRAMKDLLLKEPNTIDLEWLLQPRDWGDIFQ
jgi:hypothetical protein